MSIPELSEHERFIVSFYRASELQGALFFGRMARVVRTGNHAVDLSKHFADEASHGFFWTQCLEDTGTTALNIRDAYQDEYLEVAGAPANLMEILALTQVFERRVISQYRDHRAAARAHPVVRATLDRIMQDEIWHLRWVRRALNDLRTTFGSDVVAAALAHYRNADEVVYSRALGEYSEHLAWLHGDD